MVDQKKSEGDFMKRRAALGLMGLAPVLPPFWNTKPANADFQLDPTNAEDLHRIYRKVTYSYDDRVVYWYIQAVRMGLVNSAFIPFWEMHVGFIFQTESLSEFSFRNKTLSSIFYTDLETGKLLEVFKNPLTGEQISVRQPGLRRSESWYDLAKQVREPQETEGAKVSVGTDIGPAWIIGDDVWVYGDTSVRSEPIRHGGLLRQINDWSSYHASLKEVANPRVKSANATRNFVDINTWPAWLNMGDRPGNYVSRGIGRKSWSLGGMPARWQQLMEEHYPEVVRDIDGAITG